MGPLDGSEHRRSGPRDSSKRGSQKHQKSGIQLGPPIQLGLRVQDLGLRIVHPKYGVKG